MKLSADGVLSTYRENSNVANGLLIDPQGRLIACEGAAFERPGVKLKGTPRVTRTDLKTGRSRCWPTATRAAAGRAQRRDHRRPGPPLLHRAEWRRRLPDRRAGEARADSGGTRRAQSERHSGLARRPDAVPRRGQRGARRCAPDSAYDLQPDGTVRNMRVLYDFSPGRSADGMSIDSQGNLYASAGMNQLRGTSETLDTRRVSTSSRPRASCSGSSRSLRTSSPTTRSAGPT